MKVFFFLPHPIDVASTRQRVLQFLPFLEKNGIECFASSFVDSRLHRIVYKPGRLLPKVGLTAQRLVTRLADLHRIRDYDVAFIQREAFPFGTTFFEERIAGRMPVIYDFDDAIYMMNPAKPSLAALLRKPSKVKAIIRLADQVIAGNAYLADFAQKFNSHVAIIPTSIDTDIYAPGPVSPRAGILIGWIGSRTTISYLLEIRNALINLAKKIDFTLRIVANEEIDLGVKVEFKPWTLGDELSHLRSFDIGIMPLPNNPWTRAKCGFKIIQYMAVGTPVIASPVGVNNEIIVDGVNGFLARDQREWEDKLYMLTRDHRLREKIGKAGRLTVEKKYSLKAVAPELLHIITRVRKKHN